MSEINHQRMKSRGERVEGRRAEETTKREKKRRTLVNDIEKPPKLLDVVKKRRLWSTGFRCGQVEGDQLRTRKRGERKREQNDERAAAFANILCACAIQLCAIVAAFQIPSCVNNPSGVT